MLNTEISTSLSLLKPGTPISRIKLPERRQEHATQEKILANSDIWKASVKTATSLPICLSEDHHCVPTHVHRTSGQVSLLLRAHPKVKRYSNITMMKTNNKELRGNKGDAEKKTKL